MRREVFIAPDPRRGNPSDAQPYLEEMQAYRSWGQDR